MKRVLKSLYILIFFIPHFVFAQEVRLKNITVQPETAKIGEYFKVYLQVELPQALKEDYFFFCHLEGADHINADLQSPIPTSLWKPNTDIKIGPFYVYLPYDMNPGVYNLEIGLARAVSGPSGTGYKRIPWLGKDDFYLKKVGVLPEEKFLYSEFKAGFLEDTDKVFRQKDIFNPAQLKDKVKIFSAKNEYESVETIVIPHDKDLSVNLGLSDLENDSGKKIGKENIKIFKVEYVETKKPYYNTLKVGAWPDPLVEIGEGVTCLLKKEYLQPFIIEIFTPADTPAGIYRGKFAIKNNEGILKELFLEEKVFDFAIDSKGHLKTAFDAYEYLFQNYFPHSSKLGNDKLFNLRIRGFIDDFYLDMLRHRLNPIHNVGNPKLLGGKDNQLALDFSEFERRFKFFLNNNQSSFGMAEEWPFGVKTDWPKSSWYGFASPNTLTAVSEEIGKFLQEKEWLTMCYTYILDETYDRVEEIYGLVHAGCPKLKNLLTQTPNLNLKDVDIWCVRINNLFRPQVEEARKAGKEIWMYVAGTSRPFPNLNLDVPLAEARIIPWICFKHEIAGLLYWCVNWWQNTNPWESVMTMPEQNGNGSLYYPDPAGKSVIGSMRLKALRDGLEDYEYLYLLKKKLEELKKADIFLKFKYLAIEAEEVLRIDDAVVKTAADYTRQMGEITQERQKIARLIEEISGVLK